jgi:arginase
VHIELLLVPYDSGRRGERMGAGPEALVAAGLPDALERAGHAVRVTTLELPPGTWPAEIGSAFALARLVAARVEAARAAGAFPIVVAGNCMSALGVVAALGEGAGVAWLDAHGDFNTPETTVGGFLDGMALATVAGRCWPRLADGVPGFVPVPEERLWLLGARDLDPLEAEALRRSRVRYVRAAAVGERAAAAIVGRLDTDAVRRLYVHLDLDVLDPAEGRVNAFDAPGGVSLDALCAALRALGGRAPVAALTLSAYDPAYDTDGRAARAAIAAAGALVGALPAPR